MKCSTLVNLSAFAVLAACSSPNASTPTEDGGVTTEDGGVTSKDGGVTPSTAPLTCLEVFQCAADCTGTGCEDECFERGSADAKMAVTDVANCYQTNGCADGPCLQTNCATELGACGAQAAPPGGTPVTTVPPGSAVPTELGGKWHSYYEPNAATRDWTFNPDGTTLLYSSGAYDMPGGCKWGTITDSSGTVVVEGDKLTYYQTDGAQQSSQCGQVKTEPAPKSAYSYRWSIESNGQLLLNDINSQSCIDNPLWQTCQSRYDRL